MNTGTEGMRPKLLVVEDDPGLLKQMRWMLDGFEVIPASNRSSALAELRRHQPPVVTLDLGLPPDPANASEGLATLEEILAASPDTKVVVVTGNDDRVNALKAISLGAVDFYQKPIDGDVLAVILDRAYRLHALEQENRRLTRGEGRRRLPGLITGSSSMLAVCNTIERVAPTSATVLLQGESGTGKEVLARALHELSDRSGNRFVAINCAAIPENLLESELFGYERGAFTGAVKQTRGKIEHADGGTLLLDEIGDLPMPLQAKLLRFLQERVIERIGGREEIAVDVRVVCATHKDVRKLIEHGDFREDLYYRIAEITVRIPPLRERHGDALLIARELIEQLAGRGGLQRRDFSARAVQAIESYPWLGNVRELENKVRRGLIMAEGSRIEPEDLELDVPSSAPTCPTLKEAREQAEQAVLERALNTTGGHIVKSAELLGVSRPTIYHLMKKFGIATRAGSEAESDGEVIDAVSEADDPRG
jgi:two-component system, NtrC family, response regulator